MLGDIIIFGLSFIGIVWVLIILWQFLTGREYWGQGRDSLIIPLALATALPLINIIIYVLIAAMYVIFYVVSFIVNVRHNAVERRLKKDFKNV